MSVSGTAGFGWLASSRDEDIPRGWNNASLVGSGPSGSAVMPEGQPLTSPAGWVCYMLRRSGLRQLDWGSEAVRTSPAGLGLLVEAVMTSPAGLGLLHVEAVRTSSAGLGPAGNVR